MEQARTSAILFELYNVYRCSALNKEYYGHVLGRYQSINTSMDVLIAIGTTGSGISALTVWQTHFGGIVWGSLTVVAGMLAIAKPFLQINKRVEKYSKLFTGHLDNYILLSSLVSRVRRQRELTDEMIRQFEALEQRYLELSRDDDPHPNKKISARCEALVRQRIPDGWLWFPGKENTGEASTLSKETTQSASVHPIQPARS